MMQRLMLGLYAMPAIEWGVGGCTGEFMLARYREVVSTVLSYTRSNEKLIRRAVIQMLPRLAAFAPERFARMHLQPCTAYLLSVLRNPSERGAGMFTPAATRLYECAIPKNASNLHQT